VNENFVCLSVYSDIVLRGLCLFGSENISYSVALEINEVDSYSALGCNIRGDRNRTQGWYNAWGIPFAAQDQEFHWGGSLSVSSYSVITQCEVL